MKFNSIFRYSPLALFSVMFFSGCAVTEPVRPIENLVYEMPSWRTDDHKWLMMHYMPWYETPEGRGFWGRHWTGHQKQHNPETLDENGLPDIWSHYHPLIGLYDSADPDVLECQLLEMKLAGVDGVILDWYGIGDAADYPLIHTATKAMFDAALKVGMKFSVCYEDRTMKLKVNQGKLEEEQVVEHLTETMLWMEENWFRNSHYLKKDGAPVLLNFGPMFVKDPEHWSQAFAAMEQEPAFFALHHLWQKTGADGGFTWIYSKPFKEDLSDETVKEKLSSEFLHFSKDPDKTIASAYPGFKDVYKDSHPTIDHRDGETMRQTLEHAMEGPWKFIQLATWNDYGEGTIIEPTHEFGYTFLEIIQNQRQIEVGEAFQFAPEDLRLPARLLVLRKNPSASTFTLDEIASLLSKGLVEEARKKLATVEQSLTEAEEAPTSF